MVMVECSHILLAETGLKVVDQHDYFEAGLKLKQKANLLHALQTVGISPNDDFYSIEDLRDAVTCAGDRMQLRPFREQPTPGNLPLRRYLGGTNHRVSHPSHGEMQVQRPVCQILIK
ncbi:hypothetical protein SAY87_030979 [Trapa incisa]|uniref:Uncharacterized protein n=1 Tax=Trapa incisa TaxID=236973 RepID=A0AAN7QKA0_9MYRT|nr:hypothetical protein SAY87_030979 [Trapa incisa]